MIGQEINGGFYYFMTLLKLEQHNLWDRSDFSVLMKSGVGVNNVINE